MALDPAWIKFGAFLAYFAMAAGVCVAVLAILGLGLLIKKAYQKLVSSSSREVPRPKVQ